MMWRRNRTGEPQATLPEYRWPALREWLTPGTVLAGILGALAGGDLAFVLATLLVATADAEWLELLAWGAPVLVPLFLLPTVVVLGIPIALITEELLRNRVRQWVTAVVYATVGGLLGAPIGEWVMSSWALGLTVGAATAVSGKSCAELWLRWRLRRDAAQPARRSGPET